MIQQNWQNGRKISNRKAIKMFENGFLEKLEPGTYESFAVIHKYLLMRFMILPVKFVR